MFLTMFLIIDELKIALLIGNGDYYIRDDNINHCPECRGAKIQINFEQLNPYSSLERLKEKLEAYGFLVMSFVDLNSEEYLRV
jgi:hypothetical protein